MPDSPPPAFAPLSAPGHYAAIFTRQRFPGGDADYDAAAARMVELAQGMPGFLGFESANGSGGFGITISYWESEEAIRRWKAHAEHQAAQVKGRQWYAAWQIRIARVERISSGP